ncbi:MAG TPA: metallopeptidase TldD-related protein [Methanocorpusculum sp.]|nr:metallopeptidase TldD-related protein [Methanocorpusculum sp.]
MNSFAFSVDEVLRAGERISDEVEVYFTESNDLSLEQRESDVSSVFEHAGKSVYIRVLKDHKIGVSGTSDITRWKDCLNAAVSSAKLAEPVPDSFGFSEKCAIPAGDDPFDSGLEISPETANEYLKRMNEGAAMHKESRVVSGSVTLFEGSSVLANSNGVYLERKATDIVLGMDSICEGSTGYEYDSSPFASRINPEKTGERNTFWATASRNGVSIESGKYDVVFSEHVVDSLILELLADAVNGKNVLHGKSIYAGKLGESVANQALSITESPSDKTGSSWRRFDCEATPCRDISIIDKGVLTSLLYDRKTAAMANTQSTASAQKGADGSIFISPHCLRIDAPKGNLLEKPCLYINEVIGAHTANQLTGEFSVETANAFLCEGGRFTKPVKKAMISGNVFEILAKEVTVSEEVKVLGSAVVPKMRISGMQVV